MKLVGKGTGSTRTRTRTPIQNIVVLKASENTYQDEPKLFKNKKSGWKTYLYNTCAFSVNGELKSLTELLQIPNYKLDHPTKEKKTECFLPFLAVMYEDKLSFKSLGILGKQDKKSLVVPFELDDDLDIESENVTVFKTVVIFEDDKENKEMTIAFDQVTMTYCELDNEV